MAVPIGGRRVVLITQTDVQGEIVIYLPVVLNESRKFNSSQLLADGGRRSRNRIHQAGHLQRPVICKAQDVGEIVARNIVAGVDILRGIASKLAAELDRVGSTYPGENILEVLPVLPPRLRPAGVPERGDRRRAQQRTFRT